MFRRYLFWPMIFVAGATAFLAVAAERDVISMMSVQQRLERMERLVDSDIFMAQAQQIDALREEIMMLREQLDQQGYELNTLKQRQRSLYLDMDRRINTLETTAPASGQLVSMPSPGAADVPSSGLSNQPAAPVSAATDDNSKLEYDKAFALLKEGRYRQSIVAFQDYLKKYPAGRYADNAQYWLGEAYYANRQYKEALAEFQQLIAKYPDSSKVSGARLKIAYVYYELKNWPAAQESLQQVIKLYPDTTVAKRASERLEQIRREGH